MGREERRGRKEEGERDGERGKGRERETETRERLRGRGERASLLSLDFLFGEATMYIHPHRHPDIFWNVLQVTEETAAINNLLLF